MFTGANYMGTNGTRVSTGELLQQVDFYCAFFDLVVFLVQQHMFDLVHVVFLDTFQGL